MNHMDDPRENSGPDLEAAKRMFWHYSCSHFHLDREGAMTEYRRLGGSPERERIWREEYVAYWVFRIDPIDCTAFFQLRNAHAHEAIPALLAIRDLGDDYSKLWLAYTLMDLSRTSQAGTDEAKAARERAIALWQEILSSPNGIISEHKQLINSSDRKSLGARSAEEYVRYYAIRELERFK